MARTKQYTDTDAQESTERLREVFPPGSTAWTILRHVSGSKMSRRISVIAGTDRGPEDVTWHVARALGEPIYRVSQGDRVYVQDGYRGGIRRDGTGMDMGFDLVYSLSCILHGDGYAIRQAWL